MPAAQSRTRFATSWRLGYLSFFSRSTTDGTLRWLSVWLNRPEICRRLLSWNSFQVVPVMAHQKWDSVAAFSCGPTISPGWCCFGCWDRWHVFCKLFDPVVGEGKGTKRIGSKYPSAFARVSLATLRPLRALCNLAMASPWLVAAVTAQVLMGSLFVYSLKFTTDLSLFYSLGDNGVLLTMQVWCKTAHNAGACFSSVLGPLIYLEAAGKPFWDQAGLSSSSFP